MATALAMRVNEWYAMRVNEWYAMRVKECYLGLTTRVEYYS